jgi:hypothetical protein
MEILTAGESFESYFDEYEEIAARKMSGEESEPVSASSKGRPYYLRHSRRRRSHERD